MKFPFHFVAAVVLLAFSSPLHVLTQTTSTIGVTALVTITQCDPATRYPGQVGSLSALDSSSPSIEETSESAIQSFSEVSPAPFSPSPVPSIPYSERTLSMTILAARGCHHNNCLRQLLRSASVASPFCQIFTGFLGDQGYQSTRFPSHCSSEPRISSACSCLLSSTSTVVSSTPVVESSIRIPPSETPCSESNAESNPVTIVFTDPIRSVSTTVLPPSSLINSSSDSSRSGTEVPPVPSSTEEPVQSNQSGSEIPQAPSNTENPVASQTLTASSIIPPAETQTPDVVVSFTSTGMDASGNTFTAIRVSTIAQALPHSGGGEKSIVAQGSSTGIDGGGRPTSIVDQTTF